MKALVILLHLLFVIVESTLTIKQSVYTQHFITLI